MVMTSARSERQLVLPDLGFGSYVALPASATELALVGHLAVATVCGIAPALLRRTVAQILSQFGADPARVVAALESMTSGTPTWRSTVEDIGSEVDAATLNLVALSFCTLPLLASAEQLSSQIAERRRNAMLDLLELPYSSVETQDAVQHLAEQLSGEPGTPGPSALSQLKNAKPIAEALSFFHPFIGLATTYALDRIPDESPAKQAASFDDETLMLARIVAGLTAAHAVSGQESIAAPVRDNLVRAALVVVPRVGSMPGDVDEFSRLTWAATVITTAHDLVPDQNLFRDIPGIAVGEAVVLARSVGAKVTIHDTAAGGSAVAEDESLTWKVTRAIASDGNTVILEAVRPSQTLDASAGLDSANCDFLVGAERGDLDRHWAALTEVLTPGTELRWMSGSTDVWLCATDDELLAYQEHGLVERHTLAWRVKYTEVRHVETNKEWFDWYIRLHTSDSVRRANFGGNKPLMEDVARRLRSRVA